MSFSIALEITPPRHPLPRILRRRASLLGECATAINVIQRSDRQSSLDASMQLLSMDLQPVWHLAQRGSSRDSLRAALAVAGAGGIGQVLCVRGDHEAADTEATPTIRETIETVLEFLPGARVGATLNQYAPDPAAALRNLWPKLKAGAGYVQMQPVFDFDQVRPSLEAVAERRPDVEVIPMVMPVLNEETIQKMQERLGVPLPASLREHMGDERSAWAHFTEILAQLVASPLVAGVAVMTFEVDATEATGLRIRQAIHEAGVGCAHE